MYWTLEVALAVEMEDCIPGLNPMGGLRSVETKLLVKREETEKATDEMNVSLKFRR